MSKISPKILIFLCFVLAAIAVIWLPTQADEPTAVHMSRFDVVPLNNAVRVEWETGSEAGTSGFMIKRAAPGGPEQFLDYVGDDGFIGGEGGVSTGGIYSVTDNQVQNGDTYTYILIEVENSGNQIEQGRKTVTVGVTPTNTPIPISGGGSNTIATATPTPKTTAQASQTPNGTAVAPGTNTQLNLVTVTPKSVPPTAPAAQNSLTNANSTSNSTNTSVSENQNTGVTTAGVTEVLAQEETTTETSAQTAPESAPQQQTAYPGEATAVSNTAETYPNNDTSAQGAVDNNIVSTPVPVIGSDPGYTGAQPASDTSESGSAAPSNQSRAFLWLGFIVAMLIFGTGLVGSILLFTRKSN